MRLLRLFRRLFGSSPDVESVHEKPPVSSNPIKNQNEDKETFGMSRRAFRNLYLLLRLHEGVRYKVYKCTSGYNTIGVGHNLDANGVPDKIMVMANRKGLNPFVEIDEEICEALFIHDIEDTIKMADRRFPWWRDHDDVRQIAFIDLMFNLGVTSFSKFVNTLGRWKVRDYEGTAEGLKNSLWYRQVKTRGDRIVEMVRTGVFPTIKKV